MKRSQTNAAAPLGRFGQRVIVPVAGLVIGTMVLVLCFVLYSSVRQDALALQASTRLARTALAVKEREIGRNLRDYAVWEDAYENLHVELNHDWASTNGNVGANILDSLGYEMAFVIAPGDHTVYSVLDGIPQSTSGTPITSNGLRGGVINDLPSADAFQIFGDSLHDVIGAARRTDQPQVSLLRAGPDVVLLAAGSILSPDESVPHPEADDRTILVFAKRLNHTFLNRMSGEYLLSGLTFAPPGSSAQAGTLDIANPRGETLGQLTWRPERPGSELLRILLPPFAIALLGLAAFAVIVLRNARKSAQEIEASTRTIEAYAQTLEDSESRFRDVAEASSDWIWETDREARLSYLSGRFHEVTGVAAANVLGKRLEQFYSSDSETQDWEVLRGDTSRHQAFRDLRCCYRDAEGRNRICRLAGRPVYGQNGAFVGYRGTATDVTREVEAHERANHLALHDPLTELPNRVLLRDRLDVAIAGMQRDRTHVAVLCLDLDHFKEVNDTLGHGAGDTLLKQVAARLQEAVRAVDCVARLGGDEFAIVQVGITHVEETEALCRRLIEAMSKAFNVDDHELYVGGSIGVALAPGDGAGHADLLRSADIALYRAKEAGRGVYRFFEAQMDSDLQARKGLEQDLRQALAKNQLELYYQPLVDITNKQITGVEALLRWTHPQRGSVPPSEFVPIAEDTGLIIQIGEWALRQACQQVREWPGLRVAVNLSPVQFKHRELVSMVEHALADTGLEPDRLELEITESVLLYDTKAALEILNSLKALGVRVAMDDFGTGYSSLAYLNCFPFDKIKIDRSFITDLNQRDKSNAIVRSVLTLGQSLNMSITAEGVETLEQLKFLTREGCQQVQGYYFGRPIPAQNFSSLLDRWVKARRDSAMAPAA